MTFQPVPQVWICFVSLERNVRTTMPSLKRGTSLIPIHLPLSVFPSGMRSQSIARYVKTV